VVFQELPHAIVCVGPVVSRFIDDTGLREVRSMTAEARRLESSARAMLSDIRTYRAVSLVAHMADST
jgi:hypothetical protein